MEHSLSHLINEQGKKEDGSAERRKPRRGREPGSVFH